MGIYSEHKSDVVGRVSRLWAEAPKTSREPLSCAGSHGLTFGCAISESDSQFEGPTSLRPTARGSSQAVQFSFRAHSSDLSQTEFQGSSAAKRKKHLLGYLS